MKRTPRAVFRADRRRANHALAAAALASSMPALAQAPSVSTTASGKKVLRYAFRVAETSLDPVKVVDLYSRTLTPHIFESLYKYDHLARPIKVKPLTAAGPPESSPDFRVWTFRVRPGMNTSALHIFA